MGSISCSVSCNRISVVHESVDEAKVVEKVEIIVRKIQLQKSQAIDDELKKEAINNIRIVKVLLLGASNSGKSTVAKQMRILHTEGFTEAEKIHYKYMVHSNYIDFFSQIAKGIAKFGIKVAPKERDLVATFEQAYYGQFMNLDQADDLIALIRTFLEFACVKQVINERLNELDVPDNTEYLLENAQRILTEHYSPTHDDIIHARAATKGIYEIIFAFREFKIRLIDVGGQKTERRKWIHCFEGVAAILFIVSLSCYNQVMEEDSQINQMSDSIEMFKTMYRNRFLRSSSFIMFLNKKDIFAKKIHQIPMEQFLPKFGDKMKANPNLSGDELYSAALEFVKQMFSSVRRQDKRQIYTHVTNATDTRNIDFVFNATCDIILAKNIKSAGMN
ncbi:hypothetical protein niasHT_000331 [Heterodera trifolii]|uniref:Uncharacterized protein n=1 Tax=Heterodera trifolii TaxID=157864 RepID=A0ABD2LR66_9BILA